MPRTEEANQIIREAQREKILNSARKVFASKGWAATMAEIAAAADVSQGLAYRYFPGKEAIFRELVEQSVNSGLEILQRIREMPGTPWERLVSLVSWTFDNKDNRADFYQFTLRGMNDEATPDDLRALLQKPSRTYQEMLRSLVVEGQSAGEVVQGDPDQLVIAIIACFNGLSRFPWRHSEYFRKHFPDTRIILRMLKP